MHEEDEKAVDPGRRAFLGSASLAFRALLLAFLAAPVSTALSDEDDDESDDSGDDGGSEDDEPDEDEPGEDDAQDDNGGGGHDDDDFERGPLDQSDAVRAVRQGKAIPLSTALKRVEARYDGRVIDVTLRSTGRRLEYRFKLRTGSGSVRTIRMDARTGRFLGFNALSW